MKWKELAERVQQMSSEQQEQPALVFDENEGEFCEVDSIYEWDDPDSSINGRLYISEDNTWYDNK